MRVLIKYVPYHFYKVKINLLQNRLPGDAPTREKSAYFLGHRKRIKVEDKTGRGIIDNKSETRIQTQGISDK